MASINQTKESLRKLCSELEVAQSKMDSGELTEAEGKDFAAKAKEALELQRTIDSYNEVSGIVAKSREVANVVLPGAKREAAEDVDPRETVGYVTPGEAFVRSESYKRFVEAGLPLANIRMTGAREMVKGHIPVTREEKAAYDKAARESKSVPTFGAGVIEPTRLAGINLSVQDDRLRLLGVIDQGSTSSNSVEWIRLAYTRAADTVADSATKPEAAAAYTAETATVRTMAVTIPVTEQMLADAPALISAINGRLVYDLDKLLEEQMLYGAGSGQDFPGILNDSDVAAARSVSGDTTVDKIRRAMSDIRTNGFEPNAVVMHPLDFEEVVLTKGTDDHYLYQVFPTADGGMRVWGLAVVESNSMRETALASEPERNILVGDFRQGATLWNREAISLAVGYIDQQFVKNQRTIRAERRAAFAVREPLAFSKILTHTASGAS
jgi:HK97 family phage major capsid protein